MGELIDSYPGGKTGVVLAGVVLAVGGWLGYETGDHPKKPHGVISEYEFHDSAYGKVIVNKGGETAELLDPGRRHHAGELAVGGAAVVLCVDVKNGQLEVRMDDTVGVVALAHGDTTLEAGREEEKLDFPHCDLG